MKTDSIFYNIFQEFPFVFFALLGIPTEATSQYQFTSQEIKQLSFRIDGLFLPTTTDSQRPFYLVEVQFQPDPDLYYRLFAELFIYLKQYKPAHSWHLVIIYPDRQTEREAPLHFQEMFQLSNITRIYLKELTPPETASLPVKLVKLIIAPVDTAPNLAIDLARQAQVEIPNVSLRDNFINLLETIIVYKLPQKSREEIAAMFSLSDLKNTRFYQEVFTEGRVEGRVEGELETRQAVMLKMIQRGLASAEIAAILDLPLAEVEAARAGRSQSSQD